MSSRLVRPHPHLHPIARGAAAENWRGGSFDLTLRRSMRQTSSATFLLMGDHSQDGTWQSHRVVVRASAPASEDLDADRTSVSLPAPRAMVVYRSAPSRARA
jgi:hypothetical protein